MNGNGLDIGILGEYLYDERGDFAISGMQNDVFFGSRLGFNDKQNTSILFGGIFDLDHKSKIFSLEASRRFGEDWTVDLEANFFTSIPDEELILSNFTEDSFLKIAISKFF